MTKEYPGLPTQEEIKKISKARMLIVQDINSFTSKQVSGSFEEGMETMKQKAISLLEEKDRETIEFAEWMRDRAWETEYRDERTYTTQELLTIYRQSKQTINK